MGCTVGCVDVEEHDDPARPLIQALEGLVESLDLLASNDLLAGGVHRAVEVLDQRLAIDGRLAPGIAPIAPVEAMAVLELQLGGLIEPLLLLFKSQPTETLIQVDSLPIAPGVHHLDVNAPR